jgi:hypothetical protein
MMGYKKFIDMFVAWLQPKYRFYFLTDFPEIVDDEVIYIIGQRECPWLLAMKCPCGCDKLIQLNLLKDADPCWKFRISKKEKISISPSIWRTNGCKSHFFVRDSRIEWVKAKPSKREHWSRRFFK